MIPLDRGGRRPWVVLDLDGTLIDSAARHHAVYSRIAVETGIAPIRFDAYWQRRVSGLSNRRVLRETGLADNDEALANELWRVLIESDEMLKLDSIIPGAADWLAVASSSASLILITLRANERLAQRQLEQFGLHHFFAHTRIVPHGPQPGCMKAEAALRLKVGAISAWIGDTEVDMEAARRCHAVPIGVESGMRTRTQLFASGASAVFSTLSRIPLQTVGCAGASSQHCSSTLEYRK